MTEDDLDELRSARIRRETYVGEWLREPLVTDADSDPAGKLEMADSPSLAFLVQLVTRARRHVQERRGGRVRFEASREQRGELAVRFFAAAEEGDLEGLEELLAQDFVLSSDGGGQAPTIKRAIHGRARVARTLIAGLRAGVASVASHCAGKSSTDNRVRCSATARTWLMR